MMQSRNILHPKDDGVHSKFWYIGTVSLRLEFKNEFMGRYQDDIKISWPSFGGVIPEVAFHMANDIQYACELAEKLKTIDFTDYHKALHGDSDYFKILEEAKERGIEITPATRKTLYKMLWELAINYGLSIRNVMSYYDDGSALLEWFNPKVSDDIVSVVINGDIVTIDSKNAHSKDKIPYGDGVEIAARVVGILREAGYGKQ